MVASIFVLLFLTLMIIPQLYHKIFLFQFDCGCIMPVGAKHFGRKSPLPTHNLPAEMLRPDDILGEQKKLLQNPCDRPVL
jgi:hypothetical protein